MEENNSIRKHPKFLSALFGAFFKMFGWIKLRKFFDNKLLKKTLHDDKIPTDSKLDEHIELLAFYMEYVWPLINHIVREKTMIFFRYKLKRFLLKTIFFLFVVGFIIGTYKLYVLYRKTEIYLYST